MEIPSGYIKDGWGEELLLSIYYQTSALLLVERRKNTLHLA